MSALGLYLVWTAAQVSLLCLAGIALYLVVRRNSPAAGAWAVSAALAATIANGVDMQEAVRDAQEYTWQSLKLAFRPGMGQHIPDRLFWAREDEPADEDSN